MPFLSSLTICFSGSFDQFTELHQLVFNLPKWKYYVFSLFDPDVRIALPLATSSQSPIESLVFDQHCTFYPLVRRVQLMNESNDADKNADRYFPSMKFIHLTHLWLQTYGAEFPLFDRFIKKIEANLTKLSISTQSYDVRYLHANRWEQLITESFPQLQQFLLKYCESVDKEHDFDDLSEEIQGFFTSFWIDRRWLFDAEIEDDLIYYYIRSHRKRWSWRDFFEILKIKKWFPWCRSSWLLFFFVSLALLLKKTVYYWICVQEKNLWDFVWICRI